VSTLELENKKKYTGCSNPHGMANLLIIDDDDEIRMMLGRLFEDSGHSVGLAADGDKGLKYIKENDTDLVITDIIMPEKEGLETIRELKRDYPDIKIIVISGGGNLNVESYFKIAKTFGADASLEKPFMPSDLTKIVDELLAQSDKK